jgi:hypothetical protein
MDEEIISVRWLCKLLRFDTTFGFGLKLMPGTLPSLTQLHTPKNYQY